MRGFAWDEDGAVLTDYVVLTAVAAVFGVIILVTFGSGPTALANSTDAALQQVEVEDLSQISPPLH